MNEALEKLVAEYRPSMTLDIVHAWAADIVAALTEEPADETSWVDDDKFLNEGPGTLWHVRVASSFDEMEYVDLEVRAKDEREAGDKAELVVKRNPYRYIAEPGDPDFYAMRHDIEPIEDEAVVNDDEDQFDNGYGEQP